MISPAFAAEAVEAAQHVSHFVLISICLLFYLFCFQVIWQSRHGLVWKEFRNGLYWLIAVFFMVGTCSLTALFPIPFWIREGFYWGLVLSLVGLVATNQARVITFLLRSD